MTIITFILGIVFAILAYRYGTKVHIRRILLILTGKSAKSDLQQLRSQNLDTSYLDDLGKKTERRKVKINAKTGNTGVTEITETPKQPNAKLVDSSFTKAQQARMSKLNVENADTIRQSGEVGGTTALGTDTLQADPTETDLNLDQLDNIVVNNEDSEELLVADQPIDVQHASGDLVHFQATGILNPGLEDYQSDHSGVRLDQVKPIKLSESPRQIPAIPLNMENHVIENENHKQPNVKTRTDSTEQATEILEPATQATEILEEQPKSTVVIYPDGTTKDWEPQPEIGSHQTTILTPDEDASALEENLETTILEPQDSTEPDQQKQDNSNVNINTPAEPEYDANNLQAEDSTKDASVTGYLNDPNTQTSVLETDEELEALANQPKYTVDDLPRENELIDNIQIVYMGRLGAYKKMLEEVRSSQDEQTEQKEEKA